MLRGFDAALPRRNATAHGAAASELVSELRQTATAHRQSYRYLSHQVLLPQALAHIEAVISLRPGSYPANVCSPLVETIGEMATLVGALATLDMRDFQHGGYYLGLAMNAAKEAGSKDLIAFILGVRAFHAAYGGGSVLDGIDYAEGGVAEAEATGGASHTTRAWLTAVASELHAAAGNDYRSRELLEKSQASLTDVQDGEPPWIGLGTFDNAKLQAYRGGAFNRLGRHRDAQTELRSALNALPRTALKHRATACIDLAEAHLPLREIEETCTWVTHAVELTAQTRHADSLRRIRSIYKQVSEVDSKAKCTSQLGEKLLLLAY